MNKVYSKWKRPVKTHANAICLDCGWISDDYNTATKDARDHVRETGHKVSYEVASSNQLYSKE